MLHAVLALLIAALPMSVQAQSFRCVGKDGKKYYGQSVPQQCLGQPVEQLNAQGLVVKRFDAQASADERAKKDAEDAERRKREAQSKEEGRRDRALLATYNSEQEVDAARGRALADNQKTVKEIEGKIAAIKKRQGDLAKELAAAPDKNNPPARLKEGMKNAEIDLKGQETLLAAKRKEVEMINAKYDDEKKRFAEATKRGK